MSKTRLMSLRKRILIYTLVPVFIVILVAAGFMTYSVRQMIDNISRSEASGNTSYTCSRVSSLLDEYIRIASTKAERNNIKRFLSTADQRDEMEDSADFSYVMGELDSTISEFNDSIDRTWIASTIHPGVAFSNTSAGWIADEDFDITRWDYFDDVTESGVWVTDPYYSLISGDLVVSAASVVKDPKDSSVIGIFAVEIRLPKLWEKIVTIPDIGRTQVIIRSGNNNVIFHDDVSLVANQFSSVKLISSGNDGLIERYTLAGEPMMGSSLVPDSCAWTIYSLREYSDTLLRMTYYSNMTLLIFAAVGIIITITLLFAAGRIAKPIKNYTDMINSLNLTDNEDVDNKEILSPQGCSELEQLAVGFNSLISRNNEIMYQLREVNIKSEKQRILYQTALQSSSDVVFEYDTVTDVLITYGSAVDSSVPKTDAEETVGFLELIRSGSRYGAPDIDYAEKFLSGDISGELTLTLTTDDGVVHWLSLEGTPVYSGSVAVKAVGTIRCIDEFMTLKESVERDLFSGFYNKTTTQSIIADRLSKNRFGAVILIDVDNFKSVNDVLGHSYGDFVIKDVADKIRTVIGENDIPGRIGGDEFMMFVPDIGPENLKKLCRALNDAIRCTYTGENGEGSVSISASIGAAYAPDHGRDFESLYGSADIAMYASKNSGKNTYTLYSGQERESYKGEER